jgi:hypothetical protein
MKIYYEPYELPHYPRLNTDAGIIVKRLAEESFDHLGQKIKYRLMWELRSFEKEIEEDGCCFVIKMNPKPQVQIKEIDADLRDRIAPLIQRINWDRW